MSSATVAAPARSRFAITLAERRDDAELRALLRENPMKGSMHVTFEREPDFFAACSIRGAHYQVGVGRDLESGRIVGLGTRSVSEAFINGEPASFGWLSDLRLQPAYRGGTLVARGYRFLRELHADGNTLLYGTVIFHDNQTALRTIATGRASLPAYHDLGVIHCPGINLRRRKRPVAADCEIVRGRREMLPEIVDCLNRNNARKQFAPVHDIEGFTHGGRWRDFQASDFYVACRKGKLIGVVGWWDQSAFKQTRVISYGGRLRWLVPAANALHSLLGTPAFPSSGEHVPYFYVSFVAVDHDDVTIFRALLRQLYNDAVGSAFCYAIIGLHEHDPLLPALEEYSRTPFAGRLFCVCFGDGEGAYRSLDGRVPYVEAATL
ncbi:MAG: hypothetical protein WB780_01830 [Candidatus Acidiferrales bacterium]